MICDPFDAALSSLIDGDGATGGRGGEVVLLGSLTSGAVPAHNDSVTDISDISDVYEIWRDVSCSVAERVRDLVGRMSLEEKLGQLGSVWLRVSAEGGVSYVRHPFSDEMPAFEQMISGGLGHLARVYGSRPVEPAAGMRILGWLQSQVVAANRFGIPAVVHEECLTGFATWKAAVFPAPPCWGAAFDPELVREMALVVGTGMRAMGVHQGLAPVVDVARDPRWGRTEETVGEDPYLVGVMGAAYVTGLQEAGLQATLKHFAGAAAPKAGRNMASVVTGAREFADVILPPFEMGVRSGAKSVMPGYNDIDGVPVSADRSLLHGVLRGELGFDGVVVADYSAVSFLETQHRVADSPGAAARLALDAGIDVELPFLRCFGEPLRSAVLAGEVPLDLVDGAVTRVLTQKCSLGLLDPGWSAVPASSPPDLDSPASREIARRLASESIVLLANDAGVLPLAPSARIAVVGPLAADDLAFFGCYSVARHLVVSYPEAVDGVAVTTVLDALRGSHGSEVAYAAGCAVTGSDASGFADAVACARAADVVVAVVGDQSGIFGGGTSGEGCDVAELSLPGVQEELLHALADTGTPVVAVFITGRPYSLGSVAGRCAAMVQTFLPGEEGGNAIASVLTGLVNPSGKLPMQLPGETMPQPSSYLRPSASSPFGLAEPVDSIPLFAFGHGLSYTVFSYSELSFSAAAVATDGTVSVSCMVRNVGSVSGTEVVQLYLSDPVASVVRPVRWLAGFVRVALAAGEARRVTFQLHADRTSFTGLDGKRVVEPGVISVAIGGASDATPLTGSFTLTGPVREVGADRVLDTPVSIG